eukprot:jgi/Hompol1/5638/HPOL_004608-RA
MAAFDERLDKLVRLLNSVRGTDKVLMLVQYASKILIWRLRAHDAKSALAGRITNLAGPVSDFRILLRYCGLINLAQYVIKSELSPPQSPILRTVIRLQNVANAAYYPLEHVYWLALHKVIEISDELRDKIGMWSCRCWAAYVVLYFYQLYEEKSVLDHRRAALKRALAANSAAKTSQAVSTADPSSQKAQWDAEAIKAERIAIREESNALLLNTIVNTAYFPLTVHWSLESSSFPDIGVGIFGTIAAVTQLYAAWKDA